MSLISYGTTADFEALWYGIPDQQAIQYMEQDRQRFLSNLLPTSQTIHLRTLLMGSSVQSIIKRPFVEVVLLVVALLLCLWRMKSNI